jgi:fatty-acid peroxygenase
MSITCSRLAIARGPTLAGRSRARGYLAPTNSARCRVVHQVWYRMNTIPVDPTIDATIGMLVDGYEYIARRCKAFQSDLFRTRVMGKPAVCIHGREAAQLFYDEEKLQRHGAVPRRVVTSLFGKKAIHTLDGDAHHARKAMFLSLMTPENLEGLMHETARQWRMGIHRWEAAPSIVLFDEAQRVLATATCLWAGVPLERERVERRAHDFAAMVDAFGGVGPRLWKGKLARMRTERWLTRLVREVRAGKHRVDVQSALYVIANFRDRRGKKLSAKLAAIELMNVIRPTVAVAWYVAFAAHAIHAHPECREKLANDDVGEHAGRYTDMFMQEVRRYYPFTPYLGARVRSSFDWKGHHFEPKTLVLLDVYGTDRDPRWWQAPDEFRPERFAQGHTDAFDFIPQGGGSRLGHRCPGEWITMHNVTLALHFLTRCISYDVPDNQDLRLDLSRMPTRPSSGVVLSRVRASTALYEPAPRLPSLTAAREGMAAERAGEVVRTDWLGRLSHQPASRMVR